MWSTRGEEEREGIKIPTETLENVKGSYKRYQEELWAKEAQYGKGGRSEDEDILLIHKEFM